MLFVSESWLQNYEMSEIYQFFRARTDIRNIDR